MPVRPKWSNSLIEERHGDKTKLTAGLGLAYTRSQFQSPASLQLKVLRSEVKGYVKNINLRVAVSLGIEC